MEEKPPITLSSSKFNWASYENFKKTAGDFDVILGADMYTRFTQSFLQRLPLLTAICSRLSARCSSDSSSIPGFSQQRQHAGPVRESFGHRKQTVARTKRHQNSVVSLWVHRSSCAVAGLRRRPPPHPHTAGDAEAAARPDALV